MKISCQSCQAKYTIADEKVLGKIVKIRCKKCGATIVINGNEGGAQAAGGAAEGHSFDYAGASGSGDQWTVNVADGDQRTMTQAELTSAYGSGVVNDDTYCWKDGMSDWLPIKEIPELASARGGSSANGADQTQQEQASAAAAYPTPPPLAEEAHEPAPASGYGGGYTAPAAAASSNGNGNGVGSLYGNGAGGAGAGNGQSPAAPAAAARRQGGRVGGDLFGGAAQAGGEDDVMTSAPAGMPQASTDPGKLTGQRNENSVLFSLNALTSNAPKEDAPAPTGTEGSGLIDIRALSATMDNPGDKKKSHVDDIMNLGGGGAFSAALHAPVLGPPVADGGGGLDASGQPQKDNTKMIVAAILGLGVIAALAIVIVMLMKKPEPAETAAAPLASAPENAAAGGTATAAPPPVVTAAPTPAASVAANDNAAAPAPPSVGAAPHAGGGGGGGGGGGHHHAEAAEQAAPTPPPAPAPHGGGAPSLGDALRQSAGGGGGGGGETQSGGGSTAQFDRGAAAAALGSVSVGNCKKSDGPTGSGHIRVTFSPSGNVSQAVVDQPPFAGTAVGGCVAGKFRGAHIPAFGGAPITVGKSFDVE